MFVRPTTEELRIYRDSVEVGYATAKNLLTRKKLLDHLNKSKSMEEVKEVLEVIITDFCL